MVSIGIRIIDLKYFNLSLVFIFMKKWWRLKNLKIYGYNHSWYYSPKNIEVQNFPLYMNVRYYTWLNNNDVSIRAKTVMFQ
jgi:hypothetical protein